MTTTKTLSAETRQAIEAAIKAVRETPIADGRKVWDLLTDERSRQAVVVAEWYLGGVATEEQVTAAAWAASDAAWEVGGASGVARDAAAAAAWAAAEAAAAWDPDAWWRLPDVRENVMWEVAKAVRYAAHAARLAATRKIVATT